MSDDVLRLIPEDPAYVPGPDAVERAITLLEGFAPGAEDVTAVVSEEIRFVDQGENFERVLCPSCGERVDDWWQQEMQRAWETLFEDLSVTTACCGSRLSLNNLTYEWPAGFARFVLEAHNPSLGGWLRQDQIS